MSSIAAKEIRDWIESEHAAARGPFTADSVGAGDFVIMRAEDLVSADTEPSDAEIASVRRGMADFVRDECVEAHELSRAIRNRYGLHG